MQRYVYFVNFMNCIEHAYVDWCLKLQEEVQNDNGPVIKLNLITKKKMM